MTERRIKFRCWSCKLEYALTRDFTGRPTLEVECPYCEAEAMVDLEPYRSTIKEVYRGEKVVDAEGRRYQLPDVLPTRQVEEKDNH